MYNRLTLSMLFHVSQSILFLLYPTWSFMTVKRCRFFVTVKNFSFSQQIFVSVTSFKSFFLDRSFQVAIRNDFCKHYHSKGLQHLNKFFQLFFMTVPNKWVSHVKKQGQKAMKLIMKWRCRLLINLMRMFSSWNGSSKRPTIYNLKPLTRFLLILPCHAFLKNRKIFGFLVFSGSIKWDH